MPSSYYVTAIRDVTRTISEKTQVCVCVCWARLPCLCAHRESGPDATFTAGIGQDAANVHGTTPCSSANSAREHLPSDSSMSTHFCIDYTRSGDAVCAFSSLSMSSTACLSSCKVSQWIRVWCLESKTRRCSTLSMPKQSTRCSKTPSSSLTSLYSDSYVPEARNLTTCVHVLADWMSCLRPMSMHSRVFRPSTSTSSPLKPKTSSPGTAPSAFMGNLLTDGRSVLLTAQRMFTIWKSVTMQQ